MLSLSPSAEPRRALLTVEQFATALGVTPKTLRNKIYLGEIPCVRLFGGGMVRLRPETLDDLIRAGEKARPKPRGERGARAKTRASETLAPKTPDSPTATPRRYSGGAR